MSTAISQSVNDHDASQETCQTQESLTGCVTCVTRAMQPLHDALQEITDLQQKISQFDCIALKSAKQQCTNVLGHVEKAKDSCCKELTTCKKKLQNLKDTHTKDRNDELEMELAKLKKMQITCIKARDAVAAAIDARKKNDDLPISVLSACVCACMYFVCRNVCATKQKPFIYVVLLSKYMYSVFEMFVQQNKKYLFM